MISEAAQHRFHPLVIFNVLECNRSFCYVVVLEINNDNYDFLEFNHVEVFFDMLFVIFDVSMTHRRDQIAIIQN